MLAIERVLNAAQERGDWVSFEDPDDVAAAERLTRSGHLSERTVPLPADEGLGFRREWLCVGSAAPVPVPVPAPREEPTARPRRKRSVPIASELAVYSGLSKLTATWLCAPRL